MAGLYEAAVPRTVAEREDLVSELALLPWTRDARLGDHFEGDEVIEADDPIQQLVPFPSHPLLGGHQSRHRRGHDLTGE